MRLTVLGGSGAWPTAAQACSGYLLVHQGFRLLVDPGFAVMPRLLEHTAPAAVDAVLVSHGHPDHCADLAPLLRARAYADPPCPRLAVHAPGGALDAVLALDRGSAVDHAWDLREFDPGDTFPIGPFLVETQRLPHHVPNAGLRLTASGTVFAYTGDTGPSPHITDLAAGADLLLCEATYVDRVPLLEAPYLLSAELAGRYAAQAGAARLILTHLWPGTSPAEAERAAAMSFQGPITVARPGLTVPLP
ncbi:MBL fold metallo-hydrolase [Nocardiopsis sp. RSe5-2]|uniref:MBL fold metallo-hydrolase n=1 Tax=Nocardiopsis endophytica TaxID=3018445 RepID=A0ABT4TXU6_9ACTN|nr:MBL fold metallo-hydrolase [Nocardiopsis endophytica]MDA2809516.1 MBL fold metallo-hydrolase [Nocardiopsis endophytica]